MKRRTRTRHIITILALAVFLVGVIPTPILRADSPFLVQLSETSFPYTGEESRPEVVVYSSGILLKEGETEDYILEYPEDITNSGEKRIRVVGMGKYTSFFGEASYEITPLTVEKEDVSVKLEKTVCPYNGTQQTPAVEVKVKTEDMPSELILDPGDYEAEYPEDAIGIGSGYRVNVRLQRNFICDSTLSATFRITKNVISVTKDTAEIVPYTFTYNGEACEPDVVLTLEDQTLVEGIDYEKGSYLKNVDAGTASVKIKGINNFKGSYTLYYLIRKAKQPISITVPEEPLVYRYSKLRKKAIVLKQSKIYPISDAIGALSFKGATGSADIVLDTATGDITLRRGTPKGLYKVYIRVKASGDENHLKTNRLVEFQIQVK